VHGGRTRGPDACEAKSPVSVGACPIVVDCGKGFSREWPEPAETLGPQPAAFDPRSWSGRAAPPGLRRHRKRRPAKSLPRLTHADGRGRCSTSEGPNETKPPGLASGFAGRRAGPRPEGAGFPHRRGAGCCAKPTHPFLTGQPPVRPASPVSDRTPNCPDADGEFFARGCFRVSGETSVGTAAHIPLASIQIAIATIIRFSVSEMKPSGTLLPPPTQAHLSSRLST